jgi:hypothetical protein
VEIQVLKGLKDLKGFKEVLEDQDRQVTKVLQDQQGLKVFKGLRVTLEHQDHQILD